MIRLDFWSLFSWFFWMLYFEYPGCQQPIQACDIYMARRCVCIRNHSLFHSIPKPNFRNLLPLSFRLMLLFYLSASLSYNLPIKANVWMRCERRCVWQLISNDLNISNIEHIITTYTIHTHIITTTSPYDICSAYQIQISASLTRSILMTLFCNVENHFHRHRLNQATKAWALSFDAFCFGDNRINVKWLRIKFQNYPNDKLSTQTENHLNAFQRW